MVRLTDLPDYEREHLLEKCGDPLGPPAWVPRTRELAQMRIALITTAGLHFREDPAFGLMDDGFRPIAGDEDPDDLVMSHSSVNFDRSGFQEDINTVFPLDRFRELEARGAVGSLASVHYSFMGAGHEPQAYEGSARGLAGMLKQDKVDAVFLTPV
ncbi:MAG: glycine/sarcosine/betaine reductase selenoprotein B family protein [Halioglobus sp.]|nr:glycine/sarcosine/betaine reductase selenoprotein B family protein [Halioglobus sp.]